MLLICANPLAPCFQAVILLSIYGCYLSLLAFRPYDKKSIFLMDVLMTVIDTLTLLIPIILHNYDVVDYTSEMQYFLLGLHVSARRPFQNLPAQLLLV